ncbi:MAG: hypothetical protein Q4E69_01855 [Bacilli bacterium]|nr:hypothetical protein [Bacilli bacterium]
MNKDKSKIMWYDNANVIINLIIGLILLIILLSQSFAINNNLSSITIVRDIINHNINYLLVLVYFVALKFRSGKKYFNYLNIFLVVLYLILTITSCLSVFQAITIPSVISLCIKIVILLYLIHTMFRDTRYFNEFKLCTSPFNELSNENYLSILVVLSCILLAFNLIMVTDFDGAVISILDAFYVMLIARYIYLYREYLEFKTMVKLKEASKEEEA